MKAKEYFGTDTQVDAEVLDVGLDSAVIAVGDNGVPAKKFAWLEFLLGQNRSIKVLGQVETVEPRDTNVIVRFAFKHVFPSDRRLLLDYLGSGV